MKVIIGILLMAFSLSAGAQEFVHPGILHNSEALIRIKAMVRESREPWKGGYDLFNNDSRASFGYTMHGPYEFVSRTGTNPGEGNLHKKEFEDDCLAAYYNVLQWSITGDRRFAVKSMEIINGYSATLKGIINRDKGFEYTAKYNLGFDVPFQDWLDRTGKYHHTAIASQDHGRFRGVFEIVLAHYQNRKKLNPFYTNMVVEKIRPEGAPWTADHPGYGTLLFALK